MVVGFAASIDKEKSEKLQQLAFYSGFKWLSGDEAILPYCHGFIYFNTNEYKLTHGDDFEPYNGYCQNFILVSYDFAIDFLKGKVGFNLEQFLPYDPDAKSFFGTEKIQEKAISDINELFSREPTKGEMAWGIVHDIGNIILQYMESSPNFFGSLSWKDSRKIDRMLNKLNPDSTIKDAAKIFYKVGLNPRWDVWFETKEKEDEEN